MAIIIGGHETGLQDTSLTLLNRNDQTAKNIPGHGAQLYVNVSNGNLMFREQDVFMPSLGDDYMLVRTYNARGRASDAHQHEDARWTFSTTVRLNVRHDGGEQYFEVEYGDGSYYEYRLDSDTGLYVSKDGAGAFETIEDLGTTGNNQPSFILTRADQTRLSFDSQGWLLGLEDTNGVSVDYVYESDRLVQVLDDQGHVLNYTYQNGVLFQVTDETDGVLVEYRYESGLLSEVIDRFGHSTQYFYTNDGYLARIVLPDTQVVDGQTETYANRELNFVYDQVSWRGDNLAKAMTVTQIIDAEGNVTTFDYDFQFSQGAGTTNTNGSKKGHFKNGKADPDPDPNNTNVDKFFEGGTTTMVDALGNNRATSNDTEYVDWRLANGYYAAYDANQAATDPGFQAQVDAIKNAHSLTYAYRDDGYITEVVDQQGLHTVYGYDSDQNLVSITDNNGWGAVHSDSDYFRQMRAELGVIDAAGSGKQAADLSQADIDLLIEAFTSHFEYDGRGNLTKSIDNADNETTFTYTGFNKVATTTSAVGNAMVASDEAYYQEQRTALGYASLAADLSAADIQAIVEMHTTYFDYDANQNLTERRDAGGDITRFEYDGNGNLTRRIVFLDAADLTDPAKQQVTTYAYDGFGNNISSTDAEGHQTFSDYDHFGNLTRFTDAKGGVTTFTYDRDNRLLTITDPEGHTTVNTYDAVGNRISLTDADGHTVTRIYDLNNRLIATVDPSDSDPQADRTTRLEYDVVGNRTAVVDAEGRRTEYTFNSRREVVDVLTTEVEDKDGNPVRYLSSFEYDGVGNRIRTINNRRFATDVLYTQNNLIRQQTDANGHITRLVYDADNNQVRIIAGFQLAPEKRQIIKFAYDEEDQLTTRTDAEGNVTTFAYDAPGNRIAATDANGAAIATRDDAYYLDLRRELGYVDAGGQGKAAADLTAAEVAEIKARYTTRFEYDGNNRLVREILPEVIDPVTGQPVNHTVEHRFDGNGNQIETIDENGHSTKFTFDRDNQLTMAEDANGVKTVFAYDSRHNRTAVMIGVEAAADADGHITVSNADQAQTTRYVYDEFNQLIARTDGLGNALTESDAALYQQLRADLGYAALVADLTAADIQALRELYTQHYAYDRVGNRLSVTDHLDRTTDFTYDGLNRLTQTTDELEHSTHIAYDGNGNQVKLTDALGRETLFEYDSMDRLTDITDPRDTVTRNVYDDFGNLKDEFRAFGTGEERPTHFEYDLNNRLIARTDPGTHTTGFDYDAVGNRIRLVDGRDNATQYVYDARNRNVRIIDPLSFETRFEYDGAGNRLSLIDANSGITRFEYDPGNRLLKTVDAENRETTYAYDVRGNRIVQTTAAGTGVAQVTRFEYDAENNLRQVIDDEGGITQNDFDQVYNRVAVTDANGNTTHSEFDAVNRLVRVTDAEDQVATFEYDAVGNRLAVVDANGHAAVSSDEDYYIAIRKAHGIVDANGDAKPAAQLTETEIQQLLDLYTTRYDYDENNRLIVQTRADGVETHYGYDLVGNRTAITHAANTADAVVETFEYDLDDRLRVHTDGEGNALAASDAQAFQDKRVALGYAALVQDLSAADIQALRDMHSTSYEYDENHNRTHVTDANGHTTVYTYDANNRVTHILDPEDHTVRYFYDGNGNRTQVIDANDYVTTSYYNLNNEVTLSVDAEGFATVFEYDDNGNVVSRTLHMQALALPLDPAVKPVPAAGPNDQTTTFTYDGLNRVTARTDAEDYTTEYAYDAVGNRLAQVGPNADAATRLDSDYYRDLRRDQDMVDANGQGKLAADLTATEIQQLKDLFTTRSYYDNVNREQDTVTAEGYLTTTAYDALGNVISRTAYDQRVSIPSGGRPQPQTGDIGRTFAMVHDRANRLVQQTSPLLVDTVYEYDARGNRTAMIEAAGTADQRATRYTYDAADRVIETIDDLDTVTRLTLDGSGNVTARTGAYGTVDARTAYFEYDGNNRVVSSTDAVGTTTVSEYDGNGNVTRRTLAAGLPEERTELFDYDGNNRLVAQRNGELEWTESEYDGAGNRVRLTLAPGLTEELTNTFEFDRDNRLVATMDGELVRTEYRYDGVGNKIETIQAVGVAGEQRHSLYVYDADNRMVSVTDPMGGTTTFTYDALGNQTLKVDANGGEQESTFDALGRMLTSLSAGNILTVNTYDLRGNITATTQSHADGSDARTTVYAYDALDRQTVITDPEGFSTTIEYDAFGNQTLVTHGQYLLNPGDDGYDADKPARAFPVSNRFNYDAADRLLTLTDDMDGVNTYGYNALGDRTAMVGANGHAVATSDEPLYSEWRLALGYVDGSGAVIPAGALTAAQIDQIMETFATRYEYDLAGRLIRSVSPEGGITENRYDETGNLVEEKSLQSDDGTGQVWITRHFGYDDNARMTFVIDGENNRTEYEFDAMGNRTTVRMAAGTGDERTTRMEYDLNNRVSAEIDGEGYRTEFEYDALGNRTKATDALGRVARYYFDGGSRLTAILDPAGYINVFEYDGVGNRIEETLHMTRHTGPVDDNTAPTPVTSDLDRRTTFDYDGNNRVVQQTASDGSQNRYTYDAAGNLILELLYADTDAARDLHYRYDGNNRLVHFTDADKTVTEFTYDRANNKTSDTIITTNPNDPNTERKTTYAYDRNNRLVTQVFDPDGLNLVQAIAYDRAGNTLAKTDANGHTTRSVYDLNNRVVRQIDALQNDELIIAYDGVGNRETVTDANGNTMWYEYDNNNRIVREIMPQVEIYTIDGGFRTVESAIVRDWDAAGNEIQTIDAGGFATTRYFDGNNRLVAEINGDNALHEYSYNAAGDKIAETLYMTRLNAAAHDPAARPAPPAGESRTTTTEYDLGGRVTRIVHPAIEVTTLSGVGTDDPSANTAMVQPEELFDYDGFGNKIEAIDRNGNRILAWYDVKGRQTAIVDSEGYLTQFEYDAQDNVVEQRVYTEPLDMALVSPDIPVAPPSAGEVYQTNRIYDAASRLIEERSPLVEIYDHSNPGQPPVAERIITRFTHDGVGNQTSRTLAAGSSQQYTEYIYYDALNRQVAVIDGNRVVNLLGYDANGNQTLAKRFFNTVDDGTDLAGLDGATTDFAHLVTAHEKDQQADRIYDALDRLQSETDLMGAGAADNLAKTYAYDGIGNRTYGVDEDGYVQKFDYDANGNIIESFGPDGSGTIYEYDVAGNQILLYTGQLDSALTPVTHILATYGDGIHVSWDLPANPSAESYEIYNNIQSYVVYDTVSHPAFDAETDLYADHTNIQAGRAGDTGSADIATGALGGDSLYFRVVTRDAAGSLTWTAEQMVTLPPRLNDVAVGRTGTGDVTITATFGVGAVNPVLHYGLPGAADTAVEFVDLTGGVYIATISNEAAIHTLAYRISWEDGNNNSFGTAETPFAAQGGHTGITTVLGESTITGGSDTFYKANIDTTIPAALADGLITLSADWERIDDLAEGESGNDAVTGLELPDGYSVYNLVLGSDESPLAAGTYAVTLIGVGQDQDIILDTFEITLGSGILSGTERSVSWTAAATGNGQVVVVDGVRVDAVRVDNRLTIDPGLASPGSVGYDVFYGTAVEQEHTTSVTATEITETTTDNSTVPPTVNTTILGYDLGVSAALSAAEAAAMSGSMHLAWRDAGSGTGFAGDMPMTAAGTVFDATLALMPAGQYDLKIYYLDADGNEVIVDWLRADTATASSVTTGHSVTVEAAESGGTITLGAGDLISVDPGLYSGPAETVIGDVILNVISSGTPDSKQIDGHDAGYFVKNEYNALNALTASNDDTGEWRQFGVDANGNAVATYNYGVDKIGEAITTFSAFDGNNREIARFGAAVAVDGEADPRRLVTRFEYDGQDNIIRETTSRREIDGLEVVTERTFNALNSKTREILDAHGIGRGTDFRYDRLGRQTAEAEFLGIEPNTETEKFGRTRYKHYDTVGNLVKEVDGEGHATEYTYDAFNRRQFVTNALQQSAELKYDHRDRLVEFIDGENNVTAYAYDGRNNRTETWHEGNGENIDFVRVLNEIEAELRAMTEEVVIEGESTWTETRHLYTGTQTNVIRKRAQDLGLSYAYWGESLLSHPDALEALLVSMGYADKINDAVMANYGFKQVWDGLGRVKDTITWQSGQEIHETKEFDAYGNIVAETDGEGRVTTRVYGAFGRLEQEVDIAGRVTFFAYDDQGRLAREWNPTSGKDIWRTYDDAGRLVQVDDRAEGIKTKTDYTFDIIGNRASETTVTENNLHDRSITYEYDALGQMTRWADSKTGMHTNYEWGPASGNLKKTSTDPGYGPGFENVDLTAVLNEVEAELRALTHEVEVTDEWGNTTIETRPLFTGTLNEILRAQIGADKYYDGVFKYKVVEDQENENGTVEGWDRWTENVSNKPAALGRLLIQMGYADKIAAHITDTGYQFLKHDYTYDLNNRMEKMVAAKADGTTETTIYEFDAAGNRQSVRTILSHDENGTEVIDKDTTTIYRFDANGRVTRSEQGGVTTADWVYDRMGNVTRFRTFDANGNPAKTTTNAYYENNRKYYTESDGQRTKMAMDLTGRVSTTTLVTDKNKTFTYTHRYNGMGLETSISARGRRTKGHTTNTYNANDKMIASDRGRGNKMRGKEMLEFVYNNEGQILYRFHDTGKHDEVATHTEFAYANGHPVGQTGTDVNGNGLTKLDSGQYNLVQPLDKDFPATAVTAYSVRQGDTLQSIAAALYGNPSLWFVLAEANGIEPGQPLTEGMRIEIPNSVKSGRLTADTHAVYNEGEIVGSTLPNLKTKKKKRGWASFVMIIIIVVIAIVALVVTKGASAKISAALIEMGVSYGVATVAGTVIAGAVVGAAASIVQQGLFMALGFQEEFSWDAVAQSALSYAGIPDIDEIIEGGIAMLAEKGLGMLLSKMGVANYAQISRAAVRVAGNAASQVIEHGQITSWTSLAASVVNNSEASKRFKDVAEYVTPWIGMAENAIRGNEIRPTDWAQSVSGTMNNAISSNNLGGSREGNAALRMFGNALVAGALSNSDPYAAQAYLQHSIGNEVGQMIGQSIGQKIAGAIGDGDKAGADTEDFWLIQHRDRQRAETLGIEDYLLDQELDRQRAETLGIEDYLLEQELDRQRDETLPIEDYLLEQERDRIAARQEVSVTGAAQAALGSNDGSPDEAYAYQVEMPGYAGLRLKGGSSMLSGNQSSVGNSDSGYYQIGRLNNFALDDNVPLNMVKIFPNAINQFFGEGIDVANDLLYNLQYFRDQVGEKGLWPAIKDDFKRSTNTWMGRLNAAAGLVKDGPNMVAYGLTDPETTKDLLKSGLYAENWQNAISIAGPMVATGNPAKALGEISKDMLNSGLKTSKSVGRTVDSQRQALLNAVQDATTLSEKKGIVYGARQMQAQGYELLDESFLYRGNQGVDLVFRHTESGSFAILEAKHGTGLGSLSTYKGPLRQGGRDYNIDRLEKYIDFNPNANIDLANDLIYGLQNGTVESYGSFYRGKSLYSLDFDDTVNFRLRPEAAFKVE